MISIKSKREIEIMTEGGKILAKIMQELKKRVKPGITTKELDRAAEALISCLPKPCLSAEALAKEGKIRCSFKNYKEPGVEGLKPFPACLCTSINEEIVHVAPSDRVLKKGDIISLDIGIFYKGFHTDMAITLPVSKIDPEAQRLIRVTKKALKRGIKKAKIGKTFGDISNTIQKYVEDQGFNVVRDLCGHGIGKELHEDPKILNYGKRHSGPKIEEGMVFCLEPMVAVKDWKIKKSADGFGYQTEDSSLSAHFEHTIAITKTGPQILTKI